MSAGTHRCESWRSFDTCQTAAAAFFRSRRWFCLLYRRKTFTVVAPSKRSSKRSTLRGSFSLKEAGCSRTRTTFTKSLMASVEISKLGCTELIFVDPGAKINGQYYRDVMLTDTAFVANDEPHFWKHVHIPARFCSCASCSWDDWVAVSWHSGLYWACDVATQLTRSKSSGLLHLVCCGAARIPGAHSEHWWTSAAFANCLEQTWAADDWQCCRPMERSFGSLCARRRWTFWALTLKQFTWTHCCRWWHWALKYTDSWFQNVLLCVFLNFLRLCRDTIVVKLQIL